jgi:CheY-like chemotaxis protein/HD-like signal output (HDOD) protein
MSKILIIDDTQFWRDTTSDILRNRGHTTFTAADGVDGLALLQRNGADLILLDVEMPRLEGLAFLAQVRQDQRWKNLPVIFLTGDTIKGDILRAKQLGATDYILKSRFDVPTLLDRVTKRLGATPSLTPASPGPKQQAKPTAPAAQKSAPITPREPAVPTKPVSNLMTRDQCLERAQDAFAGKTLSGVVTQVIAMTDSKRTDMGDLADLIGRDALLTARVLHTANSSAYASQRTGISSIQEAVRVIGSSAVRQIAASVGIFDAMPAAEPDGFNPIHCWQHSLAVARLCNQLATGESQPMAYIVGLCHNLGEILFRTHFGAEYRKVLDAARETGKTCRELARQILGITRGELVEKILERLELPSAIRAPIVSYHRSDRPGHTMSEPLARVLTFADAYARAILLAPEDNTAINPWTRVECRDVTGREDPPSPDTQELRNEIFAMTSMFARLSPRDEQQLGSALPARKPSRVCLARDPVLSSFDPIAVALDGLAEVSIRNNIPLPGELADTKALVVLARTPSSEGFTVKEIVPAITRDDGTRLPALWLTGRKGNMPPSDNNELAPTTWPVSLESLAAFIQ